MTLKEKIDSLPSAMKLFDKKNNNEGWGGLCIRYRPKLKKWYCGYGGDVSGKIKILGDTPEEAVDKFIEFLRNYGK